MHYEPVFSRKSINFFLCISTKCSEKIEHFKSELQIVLNLKENTNLFPIDGTVNNYSKLFNYSLKISGFSKLFNYSMKINNYSKLFNYSMKINNNSKIFKYSI